MKQILCIIAEWFDNIIKDTHLQVFCNKLREYF